MKIKFAILSLTYLTLLGCAAGRPLPLVVPSIDYANKVRLSQGQAYIDSSLDNSHMKQAVITNGSSSGLRQAANHVAPEVQAADLAGQQNRARYHFVSDNLEDSSSGSSEVVTNLGQPQLPANYEAEAGSFREQRSSLSQDKRDYNGPLSLGDPGVSASLWHESRGGSDLFRDDRAWQPMDLLTIVVSESSEGSKQADTEIKEESSISAAIENLLGFEDDIKDSNNNVALDSLIKAGTTNDFKGEGETTRKDSLKARMSAMVVEVLPSGIVRVEGERIISVNSEEQVMVISGLVRPRDINSANEVDSSKIANLRIDYYGRGTVGEAQNGGWLGRVIRRVWPF